MAKRGPHRRKQPSASHRLEVRRSSDGRTWIFVPPRCARDRAEDLEEVESMVDAGEYEIAIEELRWLLADCQEFVAAHRLLGELALEVDQDVPLARGHFGAAYQLGLQALRRAKSPTPVLYAHPANQAFIEAGRGLAWCLETLGKGEMADEIISTLTRLDPSDPLELRKMIGELRRGGAPVVELKQRWKSRDE